MSNRGVGVLAQKAIYTTSSQKERMAQLADYEGAVLIGAVVFAAYKLGLFDKTKEPIAKMTEDAPNITTWLHTLPIEIQAQTYNPTPTTVNYAPIPTISNPTPTQVVVLGHDATTETTAQALNSAVDFAITNNYNIRPSAQADTQLNNAWNDFSAFTPSNLWNVITMPAWDWAKAISNAYL